MVSFSTYQQLRMSVVSPSKRDFCYRRACLDTFRVIFVLSLVTHTAGKLIFRDLSRFAGISYRSGRWLKYGGPVIADLDGNGCPDLILSHHTGKPTEIYFNQCNGKFSKSSFRKNLDTHAIAPFRPHATAGSMHFLISRGGGRGNYPKGPLLFQVARNTSVISVDSQGIIARLSQRGRGAICLPIPPGYKHKFRGFIRILLTSARLSNGRIPHASIVTRPRKGFLRLPLGGTFAKDDVAYVAPVDPNLNGQLHVLSIRNARIFQVRKLTELEDVSSRVFPSSFSGIGRGKHGLVRVSAVAEADFNNDGLWDLYIARTSSGEFTLDDIPSNDGSLSDALLFGSRNGMYRDVTKQNINLPMNGQSRGVTVGDFNNDGWMDILVIQFSGNDFILINKGGGKFRKTKAPWKKYPEEVGDMANAVDYNNDGRIDLVVSEGSWGNKKNGGYYRIFKNITPRFATSSYGLKKRNFLLVRIGSSKLFWASSLYALVYVRLPSGTRLMRRVGPPGVAVSVSYIELIHFGIGFHTRATSVKVVWTDGSSQMKTNVKADSYLKFGNF